MKIPDDKRQIYTHVLGQLMSDWSEEWFAAGWMSGLEDQLPGLIREIVTYPKAHNKTTVMVARGMWEIANELGHWAKYDMKGSYEPYTPSGWYWPTAFDDESEE